MRNYFFGIQIKAAIVFVALVLCAGCLQRTKVPYVADYFTFDYSLPASPGLSPVDGLVRVERFSVAQAFNSMAMVFKPEAYRFDSYPYSRWRVNPGDMTGDFLIRDLRKAGLFRGVFSHHNDEPVRFVLNGDIEEFFEYDEGTAGNAILAVNVSLLDMKEKEITRRLRFQKTYRYSKILDQKSPEGFAKAMSTNMALFSEQLIRDLNFALK
jgi:ABC-type uncharacterized transport system auxiliary subunit